jgi:hypothetical protein
MNRGDVEAEVLVSTAREVDVTLTCRRIILVQNNVSELLGRVWRREVS